MFWLAVSLLNPCEFLVEPRLYIEHMLYIHGWGSCTWYAVVTLDHRLFVWYIRTYDWSPSMIFEVLLAVCANCWLWEGNATWTVQTCLLYHLKRMPKNRIPFNEITLQVNKFCNLCPGACFVFANFIFCDLNSFALTHVALSEFLWMKFLCPFLGSRTAEMLCLQKWLTTWYIHWFTFLSSHPWFVTDWKT